MIAALLLVQPLLTLQIKVPISWELESPVYVNLTLQPVDRLMDGCIDVKLERAFALIEHADAKRSLIVATSTGQAIISLQEAYWYSLPYKVAGEYRLARVPSGKRAVTQMRIDLNDQKLVELDTLSSIQKLSEQFDPSRALDRRAFDLMGKYYAGVPAWDLILLDEASRTYVATVPTPRFPIAYDAQFNVIWAIFQLAILKHPDPSGVDALLPDPKIIDFRAKSVSAVTTPTKTAITFEAPQDEGPHNRTYASVIVDIREGKLKPHWLGTNIFIMREIKSWER